MIYDNTEGGNTYNKPQYSRSFHVPCQAFQEKCDCERPGAFVRNLLSPVLTNVRVQYGDLSESDFWLCLEAV